MAVTLQLLVEINLDGPRKRLAMLAEIDPYVLVLVRYNGSAAVRADDEVVRGSL